MPSLAKQVKALEKRPYGNAEKCERRKSGTKTIGNNESGINGFFLSGVPIDCTTTLDFTRCVHIFLLNSNCITFYATNMPLTLFQLGKLYVVVSAVVVSALYAGRTDVRSHFCLDI